MTDHKDTLHLTSLPLEVRHTIFEYVSARRIKPEEILRCWFEKKNVMATIAEMMAKSPDGPILRPGCALDGYELNSKTSDEEEEEQDDESEEDVEEYAEEEESEMDGEDEGEDQVGYDFHSNTMENSQQNEAAGTYNDESRENQDSDEVVSEESDAAAQIPTRPVRMVHPDRKWRHVPKFMHISHCAPPVELFLTSKLLYYEVKNWYYDLALLRIEATGSFAHTSFFEEALSQITESAFSPIENIRKVEVTFVWDTTWIRDNSADCVEAIFPALLRQRSSFVYGILKKAPDLKEVVIHWHDSAQDAESASFRMDILEPFDELRTDLVIFEHYIDADVEPDSQSVAGKRRVEFQNILDAGMDRLL